MKTMKLLPVVCLLAAAAQGMEPVSPAAAPSPAAAARAAADEAMPAVSTSPAASAAKPAAAASAPAAGAPRAKDRIDLEATQITGNRELPRVLYVVPWKRSDLGDLTGRPANSLLDEVLSPVDRDVFRRQNRYYDALKPDSAATATPVGP